MQTPLKPAFALIALLLVFQSSFVVHAETVSIVIASNAAPRVVFGAEKIVEAVKSIGMDARIARLTDTNLTKQLIFVRTRLDELTSDCERNSSFRSTGTNINREGFSLEK